jgi:hypothetical protein
MLLEYAKPMNADTKPLAYLTQIVFSVSSRIPTRKQFVLLKGFVNPMDCVTVKLTAKLKGIRDTMSVLELGTTEMGSMESVPIVAGTTGQSSVM